LFTHGSTQGLSGPLRHPKLAILTTLAAAAVLAAGCGSSSSTSSTSSSDNSGSTSSASSGVATAKDAVAKASEPPQFTAPGPAFTVKSGLSGKNIWYVANGLNFPFSQGIVAGLKDAAKTQGMSVTAVDGNGSPAKGANLIQQGIARKAAVIVIQSFPTAAVMQPIKAAKAAGIPVVQINDGDPGLPSGPAKQAGVFANVASCYACGGRSLADLVVANSDGKANVGFIGVPDISTVVTEQNAFKERLAELCPSCKATYREAPVAQWNGLGSLTSSLVKSDPKLNYLVPALDAMYPIMKPAVFASGAKVSVSAYNATKPNMVDLKKGQLVVGLVGNPEEWIGWGVMDEVLRALSGQKPVADEKIPNRTFTKDNTQDVDTSKPSIDWYGAGDFRGGYQQLWKKG